MENENKKVQKKTIIIIAIIAAVILIVAVALILLLNREKAYRIIKVYEVEGEAVVRRDSIGELEPYANMLLESGDTVALHTGLLTLKLDEDKYVYLEEDTELCLEATGTAENSKTTIILNQGSIVNDIQNKLNGESSYEVNTPNSTMSVRGTTFWVSYYVDENNVEYTRVSVFDGNVATSLLYEDGTISDEVLISNGKEVIIYQDDTTTDYLTEISDIDYSNLPKSVIEQLIRVIQNGGELTITEEELRKYLLAAEPETESDTEEEEDTEKTYTVTFLYNGSVFGLQQVKDGGYAEEPTLMPTSTGSWDFDFSTPITKNTEISWIE